MKERVAQELTSKARRYVQDRSEIPEGYEVQIGERGGLYYETEVQDTEIDEETFGNLLGEISDSSQMNVRNKIRDMNDFFGDHVHPDIQMGVVASPEQAVNFSKAIAEAHEAGFLDDVPRISSYSDAVKQGMLGEYLPENGEIALHPKAFEPGKAEEFFEDNHWSTNEMIHPLVHEIAHHKHHQKIKDEPDVNAADFNRDWKMDLTDEQEEIISDYVSDYGAMNGLEVVAEVYTGMVFGKEYPPEVMEIYDEYYGPEVDNQ